MLGAIPILDEIKNFLAVEKVSVKDLVKWRINRLMTRKDLSFVVPTIDEVDSQFICHNREQPAITWIGHVTFLIQIAGLNIVTDPVWASRMGFEKRLAKPGIPIASMPEIDLVLISHNHYDHLDYRSIKKLKGNPIYLVPKGLKSDFMKKGLTKVKELSWWDSMYHKDAKITFIPSQHWSRRTLFDLNASLWGGWMVEGAKKTVYFVGDTGYHNGFNTIGKKFTIDYVLMPIGAYEPEWFMKQQHVTPEEAVQGYLDLRANFFVPMHYDAFRLADDTPKEALDRLEAKWESAMIAKEKLKILKLGETLKI